MTELAKDVAIDVAELMTRYGFDLGGYTLMPLIDYWLQQYPMLWLRPAVVEALYQGRYKAISVEQILNLWQRRGMPLYHFNGEFERIVCTRLIKGIEPIEPHKGTGSPLSQPVTESSTSQVPSASRQPHASTETRMPDAPEERIALTEVKLLKLRSAEPFVTNSSIQVFRPAQETGNSVEPSRLKAPAGHFPIHQFIPIAEQSDFYQRLKAVVGTLPDP